MKRLAFAALFLIIVGYSLVRVLGQARPALFQTTQVQNLTVPISKPVPITTQAAPAVTSWEEITYQPEVLREASNAILEGYFQESVRKIRTAEAEIYQSLNANFSAFIQADFLQSFFVIKLLAHYGSRPENLIKLLSTHSFPEEPWFHEQPLTRLERLRRLQSYGFHELRKRVERGNRPELDASTLSTLSEVARQEPSLDVSIEAFQLLSLFASPAEVRNAIESRSKLDRDIIQKVLGS